LLVWSLLELPFLLISASNGRTCSLFSTHQACYLGVDSIHILASLASLDDSPTPWHSSYIRDIDLILSSLRVCSDFRRQTLQAQDESAEAISGNRIMKIRLPFAGKFDFNVISAQPTRDYRVNTLELQPSSFN
jgi:hypothetical protein